MIQINAMGDACPIPVVKTIKALNELKEAQEVEVLVDNEVAVQNLTKMASGKNFPVRSRKVQEGQYQVIISADAGEGKEKEDTQNPDQGKQPQETACMGDSRRNTVIAISSDQMGQGDEELGKILIKGFIYALTQQETLPSAILFYNSGARLTCEETPILEDLKSLEAQGVEILTCGTCLNHYGLAEKLKVGSVTNMYVFVEKMTHAGLVVKP